MYPTDSFEETLYVEMLVRKPEGERDHLEDICIDGRLILFSQAWLTFLSG